MDSHRYVSKSELARFAGVSPRTFERYLKTRRHVLDAMGVSPFAQKLPPKPASPLSNCSTFALS